MRKPRIMIKTTGKPSAALQAAAAATLVPGGPVDDVEPPVAPPGPPPLAPQAGATDGLGMGIGGLAVHPSLKGHNITGREARHTSKTR